MDAVNIVTPWAALAFVTFTLVSLARYVRGRDWNGALTILSVWVSGAVATAVFANSHIGDGIVLPVTGDLPLGSLSFWDVLITGLVVGSTATAGNELLGALDRSRSTAKPNLLTGNKITVGPGPVQVDAPPPVQ